MTLHLLKQTKQHSQIKKIKKTKPTFFVLNQLLFYLNNVLVQINKGHTVLWASTFTKRTKTNKTFTNLTKQRRLNQLFFSVFFKTNLFLFFNLIIHCFIDRWVVVPGGMGGWGGGGGGGGGLLTQHFYYLNNVFD